MFERRLHEVRRQLENSGLDGFFVSHLPHVRYLTGFTGSNALCFITRQRQHFLTDYRYREQSRSEISGFDVHITRIGLIEEAAKRRLMSRCLRIGFESQHLSYSSFESLKKLVPGRTLVPKQSLVENIAAVKEELEVERIRRAVALSEKVFGDILGFLRAGLREEEVAAKITYWHRKYGAEGDAFEPIVASGIRGALPHGLASAKKIKKGEFVTLDFGCRLGGYCSDVTRTVAIGRPGNRAKRIYGVVLDAQKKAIDAAREGIKASKLDKIARSHITKKGFGKYFSHSLGHGVGIEIHEQLRLSATSKEILKSGNVVTVEPGIYIPDFGGVRIEDDIVIRPDGCEVLNLAEKELIVL
jgi:Xaa-Pro aminopeptidase